MSVKMARDTDHMSYEKNLGEFYFCLARERLKGDRVAAYDYMKGRYTGNKVRLLLVVAENITRGK